MVKICVSKVYYTDKRRNDWIRGILERSDKLFIPPHRYREEELVAMENEQLERTMRMVEELWKEQTPQQNFNLLEQNQDK